MKKLKFFVSLALAATMLLSVFTAFGCGSKNVLRVYNCYDYIDESLLGEFEKYYKEKTGEAIKVEYVKFDTPENAYNNVKMNAGYYDLVCPSDYMIEKMAKENLLEEIVMPENGNYNTYVSPYIKKTFSDISWEGGKSLANYAAGYMWGTLGLVYNTAKISSEDMKSWSALWNENFKKQFTIKDSVRDTYFVGLAKHYASELEAAKTLTDADAYRARLKELFNDTSENTVKAVKDELLTLQELASKLEVDDGKEDIIKGDSNNSNIYIYIAWSGDAVYAMDEAEKANVSLEYSVPEEGSNVWFDGWCVPKGSKQKAAAIEFIEFLSIPENAIKNMDYIGYVSVIAGEEVFKYVKENYAEESGELTVDLGYFFGDGEYTVKYSGKYGKFAAQYPAKEVINRCVVMNYFSDAANERINNMWADVRFG